MDRGMNFDCLAVFVLKKCFVYGQKGHRIPQNHFMPQFLPIIYFLICSLKLYNKRTSFYEFKEVYAK